MEYQQLSYKKSVISYARFGTGHRIVLCFHGYGEAAVSYEFMGKIAGNQFSFYAIDLPFHGATDWKQGLNFTPDDLLQIVLLLFKQENQTPEKITLLGFSLGGRMALQLYQSIPAQVEKIILLAPDGLKVNTWYWIATQTIMGNRFFRFTMKKPGWFFGFLKLLNKLQLVNASIFKFVNYYIGNKEVRQQLYNRWTALRKIKPTINRVKSLVQENKTTVRLIYGKHDRIILPSVGEKFRKGIEGTSSISVIHSGHQVLHEKHEEEIRNLLFT